MARDKQLTPAVQHEFYSINLWCLSMKTTCQLFSKDIFIFARPLDSCLWWHYTITPPVITLFGWSGDGGARVGVKGGAVGQTQPHLGDLCATPGPTSPAPGTSRQTHRPPAPQGCRCSGQQGRRGALHSPQGNRTLSIILLLSVVILLN